ncbi:MAG: DUF5518 domain-containing protein [Candidatus Altiarchaeota archaeon]|nr:DUF5518 domain-containing protein [Candidatus Altiarchaeota archaeon]
MTDLKRIALVAAVISMGGLLYLSLNWIPVIGPLAAGFFVGYSQQGSTPKAVFRAGAYAGLLGVVGVAMLLDTIGLLDTSQTSTAIVFLTLWVLLVWNIVGVLLAGIGGMLGSLTGQAKRLVDILQSGAGFPLNISLGMPRPRRVVNLRPPPAYSNERPGHEDEKKLKFSICPQCGASNPDTSALCGSCGMTLR